MIKENNIIHYKGKSIFPIQNQGRLIFEDILLLNDFESQYITCCHKNHDIYKHLNDTNKNYIQHPLLLLKLYELSDKSSDVFCKLEYKL